MGTGCRSGMMVNSMLIIQYCTQPFAVFLMTYVLSGISNGGRGEMQANRLGRKVHVYRTVVCQTKNLEVCSRSRQAVYLSTIVQSCNVQESKSQSTSKAMHYSSSLCDRSCSCLKHNFYPLIPQHVYRSAIALEITLANLEVILSSSCLAVSMPNNTFLMPTPTS